MKFIKPVLVTATAAMIMASCGSPKIVATPVENINSVTAKKAELTENQLENWMHLDLLSDTIPGMSVNKAYTELLKDLTPKKIIVGVVDSGVDIEHEDLKNVIWTNEDEIAGNGIDDDKNGYVDDIHGWNFLGDITNENLEMTRIVKKGDDGSEMYKEAKAKFDQDLQEATQNKMRYEQLLQAVKNADGIVTEKLGTSDYTKEDLAGIEATTPELQQSVGILSQMLAYAPTVKELKEQLKEGIEYFSDQLNYNLNTSFEARSILGDNPDDFTDNKYGNNNVIGPDKEEAKHGTHVAGIIAAQRNNGIGMDGVANSVEILAVRAVPNGDEYDKDIALGIRYAVDNGAKVINTSFGKAYSPHAQWVYDAIKYAADNDVLIVNAAGNDTHNIDEVDVYPNDAVGTDPEMSDTFLTIGALNYEYDANLVATFSNYGKYNVDVFSPGVKIYSTVPNSKYEFLQGTSMASPAAAGVAALIRSYFPKLKASQVKQIIMQSGLAPNMKVNIGGDPSNVVDFADLSQSGKMVNAYNALILAAQVDAGKVKL
ncbi:Subtilase family protein [Pustulibacterium marinum]|uniref:Subtilase family protein n=1 Tax=Pustulibacterium marinum TaxID=1224947 RepID=A0A1I7ET84_9FLAO|nr:S8 family peptidase [Pustulibacterium marinum]SFU27131.1 Subtilase family protein [Pustulibacterium marinum]